MYDIPPKPDLRSRAGWRRDALPAVLSAFVMSIAAGAWCRWAVGANLGLFLAIPLLATLVTPLLVLAAPRRVAWSAPVGVVGGFSLVGWASASAADVTATEWLRCSAVLAAYVSALAGVACEFKIILRAPSLACLLAVTLGLLWLSWPVWLSPWLTEPAAAWLVLANPSFAIGSVLKHLGTWDHAQIAYASLTVLDQDVPYRFPARTLPTVLAHSVVAFLTIIGSRRTHCGIAQSRV